MKTVYMSDDGSIFDAQEKAKTRDIAMELQEHLKKHLKSFDGRNLEAFIADSQRVHAVISGMLTAVAAKSELDKVEWK